LNQQIDDAKEDQPIGNGKAVFLSDMTENEYEEYDHLENKGWKGFYKKIKNLGHGEG